MPIRDIELPFGVAGRLKCSLPAEKVLLYHAAPEPVDRLAERVRQCLRSPLDFPALSQTVLSDDRIIIALDADTPAAATLIEGCWDVFASVGVDPSSVTILQPESAAESADPDPRCELPPSVAGQMRRVRHDATVADDRAYLASTTSGERIYLSREVVDADFVLCVGTIAYDPLLGYRGTSSVLYPGLSTADAVRKSRGQGHDELGPDDIRSLRQTIDEVGWLLGVQFALQVVPAGRGGVADVMAGAGDAVFDRGKERLSEFWGIELDERPETVVVAVDAVGGDQGWAEWAAIGAALETARQIVSRDGRVIVLSEAELALSPGLEMIRESRTPRDALQPLRLGVPDDVAAATQVAKAIDWANVYLFSRAEADLAEDLFMIPLSHPDDCRAILETSDSIAFVESAQYTHARLRVPV